MNFKVVIFDFDGLMFDTEKVWKYYFIEANKKFGLNLTEQDRIECMGKNEIDVNKFLKSKYPDVNIEEYRTWHKTSVFNHLNNMGAEAKIGLFNIIEYIKKSNLSAAIVSGSSKSHIITSLQRVGIDYKLFNVIVSADDCIKSKPSPDMYLYAAKKLGLAPEQCVVLEDSYNGVKAAHGAGCFTIMIPDTLPPNKEMEQISNLILKDLNAVVDFLKEC